MELKKPPAKTGGFVYLTALPNQREEDREVRAG